MCRHVAYLGTSSGRPVALREVLSDPPYGLLRQSWEPRRQTHGTVNADGFGVGWYAEDDPVPARYRSAAPMWADTTFRDLARVIRTRVGRIDLRSIRRVSHSSSHAFLSESQ